jgi:hypothetical protein
MSNNGLVRLLPTNRGLFHSPGHSSGPIRTHHFLIARLFERDAPHLLVALSTHPGVASEKALASFARDRRRTDDPELK